MNLKIRVGYRRRHCGGREDVSATKSILYSVLTSIVGIKFQISSDRSSESTLETILGSGGPWNSSSD
ncbi:hypothetical protein T02_14808 [Trichinella nativa]|uniref:Uncharacterized protein n=1 Tax=Trichinella nativa TaxID=6335 RepID=A0A0V1KWP7_9BILA|nr:hypothetical protein T02_14808 [Trichinella nativa]